MEELDFLEKYIIKQKEVFETVLSEIKSGRKRSHWMWFIFPQINGLGHSNISKYYSIYSIEEAQLYWENEYLRNNYINLCEELLKLNKNNAVEIFGFTDALKLKSSLTLFNYIDNNPIIEKVLLKYYEGKLDERTLTLIETLSIDDKKRK